MRVNVTDLVPGTVLCSDVLAERTYVDLVVAVRQIGPDLDGRPRVHLTRLYVNSAGAMHLDTHLFQTDISFSSYTFVIGAQEEKGDDRR